MGIYAIRELDSVPDHAACNEAVALAKKVSKGTDRFINGMLDGIARYLNESGKIFKPMAQRQQPQHDNGHRDSGNNQLR